MSSVITIDTKVMVVVAHPDDEVIGVGAQLASWGSSTVLVHATDGAPPDDRDARAAGFDSGAAYARARRAELRDAISHLPSPPAAMLRLGETDQRLIQRLPAVVHALERVIAEWSPAVVVTHAYEGGHPDHDALAAAVAWVRERTGNFRHLEFAGYHEGEGGGLVTNRFAPPVDRAVRTVLTDAERSLKHSMLAAFRSQQRTLEPFGVEEEWLRPAPTYDFTQPPNSGRVWYERFDFGISSREWRALAAAALEHLGRERARMPRLTVLNVAYPFASVSSNAVGGAEQVVAQIDRALVAEGHRSIVVAAGGSVVAGELVELEPVPEPLTDDALRRGRCACAKAVVEAITRERVDVIHFHGVDCDEYLPETEIPLVVTLHLWPDRHPAALMAGARANLHLVCVSDAQRAACRTTTRTYTIRNGVDLRALRPVDIGGSPYVLLLGRISPEKGFHLAIDAARRAGLSVVIAGAVFPYRSHGEYFEHVIAPRLSDHVRFVGAVGFERKHELLAGAKCLAVPSILPETSSLAAMEALACGTPVVALRSPALEELLEDGETGFLVDDVEAMAVALGRIDCLSRGVCRRSAEERCDARATNRAYLSLYRDLAAPRARALD